VSHPAGTVRAVVVEIERLTESSGEVVDQINRLIPQLKPAWDPVDGARLAALLDSPTVVYVARCGGTIVGMAVFVPHRHLPGLRFHVEDVVVDERHRRQGVARALLYLDLGFVPSDTTVFRRVTGEL